MHADPKKELYLVVGAVQGRRHPAGFLAGHRGRGQMETRGGRGRLLDLLTVETKELAVQYSGT